MALLLFGKEELPAQFSPLPDLFERSQLASAADLAILLEPTDLTIQAGCLGNMNARLTFSGVSGHSARPWTAENAIEKAIEGLAPIAALERREAIVGGLPFYEVVSITQIEAGSPSNVIPDRAVATLNFRYAPDRTPGERGRVPALAHAGRAPSSRSPATRRPPRSSPTRRSSARCATPATSRSSPSRRGRTSPTSRRAGSTRSTSAPARPATPTAATSSSRSTPS